MQNSDFWSRITSLCGSKTWPIVLCMYNIVISIRITTLYGSQPWSVVLDTKQQLLGQNTMSLWVPALICGFCMQYSDFWTRITSLYGSKTSPVALCMQYSVISTGMTSLYGFQPSSVIFASSTATLGPDIQVCIGPRPHLLFWADITACLTQE